MPYTAQNGHRPMHFTAVLRCLSITVSATMTLYLLLWVPVSPSVIAQRPASERLATAESQISDLRDTVKELRAMAQSTENKINTIAGVGTGAFATLAILDILQLLGAKRRSARRDDG
jgi:hypothetical protein